MSAKELDRLEVVQQVAEQRLSQVEAGDRLGLTTRQVRRICRAFEEDGAVALVSKRRGRPSNRRLSKNFQELVIGLVQTHYADFGPLLAREKLLEHHDVRVGRETLRKWMTRAGLWLPRRERIRQAHQPRHRRASLGELVQLDGCDHEWFEDRAPRCTLLVYVDDATGRLMELRFVEVESAFDYFAATRAYLVRHGRPVAFYSDKHSIFRVARTDSAGRSGGVTQFGRALAELNIDIICANSPQAKGRVERMNKTLQDRLVKELRLRGISSMAEGNAYLITFMEDYNRRFAHAPRNPEDAHRPLRGDEDLDHIFAWREDRCMSTNLAVHFKRRAYLVTPTPDTLPLGKKTVQVYEWEDGRVELRFGGRLLPYTLFDKNPIVGQGDVVENKRLGAALSAIKESQRKRDTDRLASRKLTLREKDRLRAARDAAASLPGTPALGDGAVAAYLRQFAEEQKHKRQAQTAAAKARRLRAKIFPTTGTSVEETPKLLSPTGVGDAHSALPGDSLGRLPPGTPLRLTRSVSA
jgi:transposase